MHWCRLVSCSPKHQTELFDLALGGLGQYALIVRAKLRLIPAQSHIVFRRLTYDDIDALISDDIQLAKDGRYDFLSGGISHQRGGDYIRIGKFYTGPNEPDLASLEAGLKFKSKSEPERLTHSDYLDKNPGGLTARPRQAQADRPAQPNIANIAVLMPASAVRDYVAKILATPSEKVGLTLFGEPFETRRFTRPLFKVPGEDIAFAMWIYRGLRAAGGVPISTLQETNRKLLERMRAVGGKAYPPYAPYFSRVDWEEHYGSELWHRLSIAKKRFDPKNVLTPGPGIFSVKNGGTRS